MERHNGLREILSGYGRGRPNKRSPSFEQRGCKRDEEVDKTKMLASNYKKVVEEKLREHIVQCRMAPAAMFHSAPKINSLMTTNPSFISVGEWVEVDADRWPGFNSEGV
jgi:hypothetical protein